MFRSSSFPSRAVLQAARPKPAKSGHVAVQRHATYLQRYFGASAQHWKEKTQSFKSQLYETTQQRLKRERAEQERFAQYQTQSPGGRYAALIFGMTFPVLQRYRYAVSLRFSDSA